MLYRVKCLFDWFNIPASARIRAEQLSQEAFKASGGMVHLNDYLALSAVLLRHKPKLIFEIGTYLGVTSDFLLRLLPDCEVVSVAYVRRFLSPARRTLSPFAVLRRTGWAGGFAGKNYNNSELSPKDIGSHVGIERRNRLHQLYGDSHKLKPSTLIKKFGLFDLVFIDGDHCRQGVRQDTELAKSILADDGTISWHDANPKEKYSDVRLYLEQELPMQALATMDDYIGGIACWSKKIEKRILRLCSESAAFPR